MTYLADLRVLHSAISIMRARWDYGLLRSPDNGLLVLLVCRQVSIFGHFGNQELTVTFLLVSLVFFSDMHTHLNVSCCILEQEHSFFLRVKQEHARSFPIWYVFCCSIVVLLNKKKFLFVKLTFLCFRSWLMALIKKQLLQLWHAWSPLRWKLRYFQDKFHDK
jgi:hypothetical protein